MKVPTARKMTSGNWFIQLRLNGQNINITAETKAKAQAKAMAIKSGLEEARRTGTGKTLGEMVDAYIDARDNILSPGTIREYRSERRNHFQAYMDRDPATVDWQTAVNLEARRVSNKTLKNVWGLMKSVLKENGIAVNVKIPSVKKTPMPWLTPEQIPVFLEAVRGHSCELPALLGLCSLRRSEIFGLTWDDIDLAKKVIRVHGATVIAENGPTYKPTTKTSASTRTVPIMIPRLLEMLNATPKKAGPVCVCNIGTPYYQINAVCRSIGLPEIGMHGLRRSFASLGYHLGLSEMQIMAIGGWSDFQIVHKFYLYLSDLDRAAGEDKISSFFSNC